MEEAKHLGLELTLNVQSGANLIRLQQEMGLALILQHEEWRDKLPPDAEN